MHFRVWFGSFICTNIVLAMLSLILPPQADLEKRLKGKEKELRLLKRQGEEEKEELLKMVSSRDQEHKKQLESVKKVSYV